MRQAERDAQPGGAVRSLIDDFFNGRSFTTEKVAQAVNEFGYALGGIFGMAGPELFNEHVEDEGTRYVPPPPPVDELAEKRAALRRAKVELGFAADEPITLQQVKDRHRVLARRHHPDRGGSVEKMQIINAAVDLLEQAL